MLGNRIRERREHKSLLQKDVANYIGISQQAVARWEKGETEPDSETLVKLAELFGCSVDYLLGRTDDPRPLDPDIKDAPLAFYGNTEGLNLDILKQIISEAVNEALEEREKKKKNEL